MVCPVVDERMRLPEDGIEQRADGEQIEEGQRKQAPAAEKPLAHPHQAGLNRRGNEGQQGREQQRVGPEVHHEPEVLPGREHDPLQASEAEVIVQPEGGEAVPIAVLGDQLRPGLRGYYEDDGEQRRDHQPGRPAAREGARPGHLREDRAGGIAGDNEQQRQPPRVEREHRDGRPRKDLVRFHVPAPRNEIHADMIEDEQRECPHPQPVQSVMPPDHRCRFLP